MNLLTRLLASLCLLAPLIASAETVELETRERYIATAKFQASDEDNNPVLILHGFLSTANFSTVERLANTLYEAGYTVLSPTLSLGLHRRRQSLACEAIHTHSSEIDSDEIKQWVEWLYEKTGKKVTLIGHSSGSITLLNYLDTYGKELVERVVLISMAPFTENTGAISEKQFQQAQDDLKNGHDSLFNYQLSYCDIYPTTSSAFLSYRQWDSEKLSELTTKHSDLIKVIMGTNDKRLSKEWKELLNSKGVDISYIEGANHFFDQAHEFDLAETMENLLQAAD